jgi:hypothetical protein
MWLFNSGPIQYVFGRSTRSHAALMIKSSTMTRLLQSCGSPVMLHQGAQAVITDILRPYFY